ncbi:MAG: S41 family peptidase [Bryobacterales bacterium]|nr:S41 family peptidase [Bryobacteraceae bacterium]MDW8130992.1 S41 family peptidase [Bryobacterales bacterium]
MGARWLAIGSAVALAWLAPALGAQGCAHDAVCGARLAALGRLWAAAKYFHPWLAWRDVDWDAALLAAVPRVMQARSVSEYRAAVQGMLDALDDPATRVLAPADRPPPGAAELARLTPDAILVVTLNPATVPEGREDGSSLAPFLRAWPRAKAVVFDLREHEFWQVRSPAIVGMLFQAGGVNHLLQFAPMHAPAHRSRMYSGLPSSAPGGSLFYHPAWYVRDGTRLEARSASPPKPVVFLVDESSLLPPIVPALQVAGLAWIVAQGRLSEAGLVERHRLTLTEGVEVMLRTGELLHLDGSTGLAPDLTLSPGASREALDAALALARNPPAMPASERPRPPLAVKPRAENAYSHNEYPHTALRLLAAFRLWAAVRYFFPYRHLMASDWDSALLAAIPQLLRARDAREYALAIAEMTAHLGDTHAMVSGRALDEYFGLATPPVRTRMVEGSPVVWSLLEDRAGRHAALAPGDVVLAVDGEPAADRIRRLARYVSASTTQSLHAVVMERWLDGPPGSSAQLTVRDPTGRVRVARLPRRNQAPRIPWRDGPVWTLLAGQIGYVDLERLTPQKVDEMFQSLASARALIFDLRGYPQGTGWLIAARLAPRPGIVAARFRRPLVLFPEGRAADVETLDARWDFYQHLPEPSGAIYRGQIVALMDERTLSQAEHAALFLRALGARLVGSPSAGANGDVTRIVLPGGLLVSFSGQEVSLPDGSQLQRVGLRPDVEVKPTIEGVRAGRDEVLEKALELLGVREARLDNVGEAR